MAMTKPAGCALQVLSILVFCGSVLALGAVPVASGVGLLVACWLLWAGGKPARQRG